MDNIPDDTIFEMMKHLDWANFAFRATCRRFWALFNKNRATLEKKGFVICTNNTDSLKNWAILAHNSLFPNHVVIIWSPTVRKDGIAEVEETQLRPEFALTEFFIGISKNEKIDGCEVLHGKFYFIKFGPKKLYPIYFGKASWDDHYWVSDKSLISAKMKYKPSPEYLEKFEKHLNRNIFNNIYEYFIKGTKLENIFGATINQHLDKIWD